MELSFPCSGGLFEVWLLFNIGILTGGACCTILDHDLIPVLLIGSCRWKSEINLS